MKSYQFGRIIGAQVKRFKNWDHPLILKSTYTIALLGALFVLFSNLFSYLLFFLGFIVLVQGLSGKTIEIDMEAEKDGYRNGHMGTGWYHQGHFMGDSDFGMDEND